MVRRNLLRQIEDAKATVLEDVPHDLVTNWCEHIRISQQGSSPLGQMTNLPIGLKTVDCPYANGLSTMTVRGAASAFIEPNCPGCPHHREVHPNNLGREIVERVQEQKRRADETDKARDELQSMAPPDPLESLRQDADSDESVREVAGLLLSENHKMRAVQSLVKVAAIRPELFSENLMAALQGAFGDPEVGSQVIEITRRLAIEQPGLLRDASGAAQSALRDSSNMLESGGLLVDALDADMLEATLELAQLFVLALPVPHHFPPMSDGRPPNEGFEKVALRFAALSPGQFIEGAKSFLAVEEDNARAKGAAAARLMAELDIKRATDALLTPLLKALEFDDDDGVADASIKEALATVVRFGGRSVAEVIFEAADRSEDDIKEAILSIFRLRGVEGAGNEFWLPRLIESLAHPESTSRSRANVAEIISSVARQRPDLVEPYIEELVGMLAIVVTQREELAEAQGDAKSSDPEAMLRQEGGRLSFHSLLQVIRETIGHCATYSPDSSLQLVLDLLANTSTDAAAAFKAELIELASDLSSRSGRSLEVLPLLFGNLLDPKSAIVRARAAQGIEELPRDIPIPDEIAVALSALLIDKYLGPVLGAIRAFRRVYVEDPRLAWVVANRLYAIFETYESLTEAYRLVPDTVEAFLKLAHQHPKLYPHAMKMLATAAATSDYYAAKKYIGHFHRFALGTPQAEAAYIDGLISYYQRFHLVMTNGNYIGAGRPDDQYESFYNLSADVLRPRLGEIKALGLIQAEPRNRMKLGLLLVTLEQPEAAADLFESYAESIVEPRYQYDKDMFGNLSRLLRAEASLENGEIQACELILEDVRQKFAEMRPPSRPLPFGLTELRPKEAENPASYLVWVRLRLLWLSLRLANLEAIPKAVHEIELLLEEAQQAVARPEDDSLLNAIRELVELAKHGSAWYLEVLAAGPQRDAHRDAMRARLKEAIRALDNTPWVILRSRLELVLDTLHSLTPEDGIAAFLSVLAELPFPTPALGLVFDEGRRWTVLHRPASRTEPEPSDDRPEHETPVAVVTCYIDGMEAPQVTELEIETIHDLRFDIELSPLPSNGLLRLVPASVIPVSSYDFPTLEVEISEGQANYTVGGQLVFKHSQTSDARPLTIKTSIEIESEGRSRTLDVFGKRTLAFRLLGKGALAHKVAEEHVAFSRVMNDLNSRVPARHEKEESVISAVLSYAAYHLKDPYFVEPTVNEKDFQRDFTRHLWLFFHEDVLREVRLGRGYVDTLAYSVPIELKVRSETGELSNFVDHSLPQAAQYTVSQGRRVGVLVLLDLAEGVNSAPPLESDVEVRSAPHVEGLSGSGNVEIVVVVVRGALKSASQLKP